MDSPVIELIAQRVHTLRSRQGLSLRELGARAGASAAMLSDLERGTKSPTISLLSAIARALGVPLSQLVDEERPAESMTVLKRAAHHAIDEGNGVVRMHLGPTVDSSSVEFVRIDLPPGGSSGVFAPHAAGSLERVHVHAGSVEARIGGTTTLLEEGDSLVFLGDRPHSWANPGRKKAAIYLVIQP
jgi:transcriptional regulator with XRE-family HTH domain